MYIGVYLVFGKPGMEPFFVERKMNSLEEVNLFNDHMDEEDMGTVFYLRHYDVHYGAQYLVVVNEGKEDIARKILQQEAQKTLQERIQKDAKWLSKVEKQIPVQNEYLHWFVEEEE